MPFHFKAGPKRQVSHAYPPFERRWRRWKHSAIGEGVVSTRPGCDSKGRLQVRRTTQARRDHPISGHQRVRVVRSAQRGAVLIGAQTTGRLGARHNPDVARQALDESRSEVEALFSRYSIIILVGTGGKGTGSGTMFPLAQIARQQKKLVIPIFVRPSFERHEVDKRHYDHAVNAVEQFDSARIRLIEILNDRGYMDSDPQSQPIVWERMNLPIARGLRGLIYVLWDLSQVDPSDLSMLFAGDGRLRIGFAEIDPPAGR